MLENNMYTMRMLGKNLHMLRMLEENLYKIRMLDWNVYTVRMELFAVSVRLLVLEEQSQEIDISLDVRSMGFCIVFTSCLWKSAILMMLNP